MSGLVGLVIGNGAWADMAVVSEALQGADFTLACDGALERCLEHGIDVDAVVGDMDSVRAASLTEFKKRGGEVVRVERQDTNDLAKALDVAEQRGATRCVLVGFHGGDVQHETANLLVCGERTMELLCLTSTDVLHFLCPGRDIAIELGKGTEFSVFPYPSAGRISISGCEHELVNESLKSASHGLHNRSTRSVVRLRFEQGRLLMVYPHPVSTTEEGTSAA